MSSHDTLSQRKSALSVRHVTVGKIVLEQVRMKRFGTSKHRQYFTRLNSFAIHRFHLALLRTYPMTDSRVLSGFSIRGMFTNCGRTSGSWRWSGWACGGRLTKCRHLHLPTSPSTTSNLHPLLQTLSNSNVSIAIFLAPR